MDRSFAYELRSLPELCASSTLIASFDNLPLDHYVDGSFRRRRLSRFVGGQQGVRRLPREQFVQSADVNQYLGNIRRDYEELEEQLVASRAFKRLLAEIESFFGFDPQSTVLGVHQIRITCSVTEQGEPAPEGIHQDGFDWLTIACVARSGVVGAATELYRNPKSPPMFSQVLQPGQLVHCNDREIYHYTSPIAPTGTQPGHRDVFVVTASHWSHG